MRIHLTVFCWYRNDPGNTRRLTPWWSTLILWLTGQRHGLWFRQPTFGTHSFLLHYNTLSTWRRQLVYERNHSDWVFFLSDIFSGRSGYIRESGFEKMLVSLNKGLYICGEGSALAHTQHVWASWSPTVVFTVWTVILFARQQWTKLIAAAGLCSSLFFVVSFCVGAFSWICPDWELDVSVYSTGSVAPSEQS